MFPDKKNIKSFYTSLMRSNYQRCSLKKQGYELVLQYTICYNIVLCHNIVRDFMKY